MDLRTLLTEKNVGGYDLLVRALLGSAGTVALAMDLVPAGTIRWVVAFVAWAGLYTALMRHCSPYVLMGFSTAGAACPAPVKDEEE